MSTPWYTTKLGWFPIISDCCTMGAGPDPSPGAANTGLTPFGFGWKYLHESPYLQAPVRTKW
uniref:Uncharacterized protein n=1 Tax=Zea mays TaxID=4577 RepID=B7ZZF9_MAIZE|nr:unknown [Zea mays]